MKKLLLLCSLVYAINASAEELPIPQTIEEWEKLAEEYVEVLLKTPEEKQSEASTPFTELCDQKQKDLNELTSKKNVTIEDQKKALQLEFEFQCECDNTVMRAIYNSKDFTLDQKIAYFVETKQIEMHLRNRK